jgi:hypothetical protein
MLENKNRGRKINPDKKEFFKDVKNVSRYMPKGYAIQISKKLGISIHIVYNVKKCRTLNKNVLQEMKKIKEQIQE